MGNSQLQGQILKSLKEFRGLEEHSNKTLEEINEQDF